MVYNNIFLDLVKYLEIIHSYNILLFTMFSKHFLRFILYFQRNSISIILLETFFSQQ